MKQSATTKLTHLVGQAAREVPAKDTYEHRMMLAIVQANMSDQTLAMYLMWPLQQVRSVRTRLVATGLMYDSGNRRTNVFGDIEPVWAATTAAKWIRLAEMVEESHDSLVQ